jgi:calcium-dependent protein kinase
MGICDSKNELDNLHKHEILPRMMSKFKSGTQSFNYEHVQQNNNKLSKEYMFKEGLLGKGAFGEVRKAINISTSEIRAIKSVSKNNCSLEEQDRILNEINVMKSIDHPNIVKIYEYFQDSKFIYIVMEMVQGKNLMEKLHEVKSFPEKEAAGILHQILSAVNYLHKHQIVHRDLKPENILFDGSNVKITDFGASGKFQPNSKLNTLVGTSYYIAPEVIGNSYNEKCDVWSIGVIMYILLSGVLPFNGQNDEQIFQSIKRGKFSLEISEFRTISESPKTLIRKFLCLDPKERITIEEALKDKWFEITVNVATHALTSKIISNLQTFKSKSKIQAAVYHFMVSTLISESDKRELTDMFKTLDKDNDGAITAEELVIGLGKTGYQVNENEINELVLKIDKNHSNGIDYTEFLVAAVERSSILTETKIRKCFRQFDKDNSGKISLQEFRQIFQETTSMSEEIWFKMIRNVDRNKDGEIEFNEFNQMMHETG